MVNHSIFSLPCEGSNSLQESRSISPTWSKSSQLRAWAGLMILMGCLSPQQSLNGPLWRRGPEPWSVSLGMGSQLGDLVFATDVGVTISPGWPPWSAHCMLMALELPGSPLIHSVLNLAKGLKMLGEFKPAGGGPPFSPRFIQGLFQICLHTPSLPPGGLSNI